LGKIHEYRETRDAVHLAVEPVQAVLPLKAGDRFWVVLYPGMVRSLRHVWMHPDIPMQEVEPLSAVARVEHSHQEQAESRSWLEAFCKENGFDLGGLAAMAYSLAEGKHHSTSPLLVGGETIPTQYGATWAADEECLLVYGPSRSADFHGELDPAVWHHLEVMLGIQLPEARKIKRLSCSC